MKRILALLLICSVALLSGCGRREGSPVPPAEADPPVEVTDESTGAAGQPAAGVLVRVAALKGPTAMGLVQLMDAAEGGGLWGNDYDFSLAGSVDEITPRLVKGEVDIAMVPANLAAALHQNTGGGVWAIAVNTLGVLYLLERGESVTSAEDLRGRTILASGKGATPEIVLRHILLQSGIDPDRDVDIQWKSEHAECLAALLTTEGAVALLPQPFVTTARMKNPEVRVALDLNELWEALPRDGGPTALITGAAVVRAEFAQAHPEAVDAFLEDYARSVAWVNGNLPEAARRMEQYGIIGAEAAELAIPDCHIVCITGTEMREMLGAYLQVLYGQSPQSVGGALPGEEFYYVP